MNGAVTLPPYPEYQSVDDTWFARIPLHWKVTPLRGVLNQRNEKNNPIKTTQILSLSIAHGVTLYSDRGRGGNKRKGDLSAYKIAYEGDIVLNSMNVIVGAVGLSRYTGAISPVYYALYPNTVEASINYYDKVFSNPVFQRYLMIYGRGILIKKSDSGKFNTIRMKISPNDLKGTLLPLPPRPEQDQIVAYLRAQDAHIARFIKAKRDLIALLTEQKLRIIDHAVTLGLDASVALKPSGVEWLGEVPEHWRVERLKWVCRFTYGDSLSDANRRQGNVPVYGSNGPVGMHDVANAVGPCIVIGRKGSFGKVNYSERDLFAIDTTYFVDKKCTKANIRWLYYLLVWCRLDRISKDSAVPGLDRTDALNTLVPVPDEEEQEQIANQLDIETAEVIDAITKVEAEIKLIREYRDRLIADVVTGQVDVRGWVPGPDDVVTEEDLAALGGDEEIDTDGEEDDGDD